MGRAEGRRYRNGVMSSRYPDFAIWQPFLDEIISHPAPDAYCAQRNFRRTIDK